MSRPKVIIDKERCNGTGVCVLRAPNVFDQSSDDGKVFVIENCKIRENLDAIREAIIDCPNQALSFDE